MKTINLSVKEMDSLLYALSLAVTREADLNRLSPIVSAIYQQCHEYLRATTIRKSFRKLSKVQ